MNSNDFFQNMDNNVTGNNNTVMNDMNVDINMMNPNMNTGMPSCGEGVKERIINRTFVHDVPQDCFFMIEK